MSAGRVGLGRIGAPFGLKGWMHVASYTDPPEALLGFPRWDLSRTGASLPPRPQGHAGTGQLP